MILSVLRVYLTFMVFIRMMTVFETKQSYTRHTDNSYDECYDGSEFSLPLTVYNREEIRRRDIEE
jgi:hypothetical protein